ncbi:ABC-ATPase domain-containing protein [Caldalkalibacillus thermarum TA2.A1]|uniref:ABC-ATPase domain-containing protein n=1 Tax=Caldalkalibacillus thermarum (strain TA2.A1) TaxID=986075 RepID=A0A8X8I1P6_CALTT|nr:ABC-ATPase domain-containing protein [Caldalkalibacillus thermarum]QZT32595.1 ABC-ATPase domain-containing protein [Caldalkalibacillus thermarum TA2.A1]
MQRLHNQLRRIDGKGYKAYKDLQGSYRFDRFRLHIDHVQGDPFASPSRIRIEMSQSDLPLKAEWFNISSRQTAVEDFLARETARAIRQVNPLRRGTGKSGMIAVDEPGQEILKRTAVRIFEDKVELRLSVGLPAQGRRILAKEAERIFFVYLPSIVERAFFSFDETRLVKHVQLSDQQEAIRVYLKEHGLVAFVANGAILPRESGVSNRPMSKEQAVPFKSPPSMEVEISLPHGRTVRGMAIPRGITLIVGGGYHGKSTLLKALERGVYNHIEGDGREFVITDACACKVRAEDGRRVEKVNISPFISNLPFGKDTTRFSTDDASGSTSQAANIMELLEMGAKVLLIDEDTSATNFMIRDARMQRLVHKGKEPITPFVDKVRQLYEELGVSTILVVGGSGDYFDQADHVIMMDEYQPYDVTQQAKTIAETLRNNRQQEGGFSFGRITERAPRPDSFNPRKGKKEKVDAKGLHHIQFGKETIDLTFVEQLVDPSQTRAIANMIHMLAKKWVDGKRTLPEIINELYKQVGEKGPDVISPFYGQHPGDLALPRSFELAAAINRLRSLRINC